MESGICGLSPCIHLARDSHVTLPQKIKERTLTDYMLIYVKEGNLYLKLDKEEKIVYRQDACLFKPGQTVALFGNLQKVRIFLMHFDLFSKESSSASGKSASHPDPTKKGGGMELPNFLNFRSAAHLEDKFLSIIEAHKEPGFVPKIRALGYFLQLWSYLLEEERKASQPDSEKKFEIYEEIHSFIEGNYTKPITLLSLGETFHISPCHLQKIFKKLYGISPYDHITHLRITKAKELLIYSPQTMTEIAQNLGFGSLFSFGRAFERLCGISPAAFRAGKIKKGNSLKESPSAII